MLFPVRPVRGCEGGASSAHLWGRVSGSEIGRRMSKESVSGQEHICFSFHLSGSLTHNEAHAGKWEDGRPRCLNPAMWTRGPDGAWWDGLCIEASGSALPPPARCRVPPPHADRPDTARHCHTPPGPAPALPIESTERRRDASGGGKRTGTRNKRVLASPSAPRADARRKGTDVIKSERKGEAGGSGL